MINGESPKQQITGKETFAVNLFGSFLILIGVNSIMKMIHGVFADQLYFNLNFIALFIGIGLLNRKDHWRRWAVVVVWLGIVFSPIIMVLVFLYPPHDPISILGIRTNTFIPWPILLLISGIVFLFSLWQRSILSKASVKQYFSANKRQADHWWVIIVILSILFIVIYYLAGQACVRLIDSIKARQATIEVVDAQTGEHINFRVDCLEQPANLAFPKASTFIPLQGSNISGGNFLWVSVHPMQVDIFATGYKSKTLWLGDEENHKNIKVELTPKSPSTQSRPAEKEE